MRASALTATSPGQLRRAAPGCRARAARLLFLPFPGGCGRPPPPRRGAPGSGGRQVGPPGGRRSDPRGARSAAPSHPAARGSAALGREPAAGRCPSGAWMCEYRPVRPVPRRRPAPSAGLRAGIGVPRRSSGKREVPRPELRVFRRGFVPEPRVRAHTTCLGVLGEPGASRPTDGDPTRGSVRGGRGGGLLRALGTGPKGRALRRCDRAGTAPRGSGMRRRGPECRGWL